MTRAKTILAGSMAFVANASASFNDGRLNLESASIGASLNNADTMSEKAFRKIFLILLMLHVQVKQINNILPQTNKSDFGRFCFLILTFNIKQIILN